MGFQGKAALFSGGPEDSPRKLAAKRLAVRRQAFRRVMAREALLQDAGAPGLPDSELHGDRQNFHLVKTIFVFWFSPAGV